jgi:hypothetical protein
VITARHGRFADLRIVRGREAECARLYGLDSVEAEALAARP